MRHKMPDAHHQLAPHLIVQSRDMAGTNNYHHSCHQTNTLITMAIGVIRPNTISTISIDVIAIAVTIPL